MNWKGKKVLVTGAGGFIGSHLVETLVKCGARPTALVHYNSRGEWGWIETYPDSLKKKVRVIAGDIRDPDSVRKAVQGQKIVFHLASLISIPFSYDAPENYLFTNVRGAMNVLRACMDEKVEKIVHTSTSEVYGTAQYVPIDEGHPLQGQSPYSASKIGADKVVESYFYSYGVPATILRPFNTFGPRQSARAIIPTIISQALSGKDVVVGATDPIRDFLFVEDTVNGFLLAAASEKSIGETIHIGTGTGVTIKKLISITQKLMGKEFHVVTHKERIRPGKSEVMRLVCDNRKARALLKWEPTRNLEEGLRETIDWIAKHLSLYKSRLYNI